MTVTAAPTAPASTRTPWYSVLYIQVLIAIALGILIGHFYPNTGKALKPLGDGFISLIKMMIAPVIFCTVVHGISSMGDLKRVGAGRPQGIAVFRGRLDHRTGCGFDRRRDHPAGERLQH